MNETEVRKIVADAIRGFAEKLLSPSKADVEMLDAIAQKAEKPFTLDELRRFGAMMREFQKRCG